MVCVAEGTGKDFLLDGEFPEWTNRADGSGIGLAITRRLIREHGGSIKVESEEGKGTRFIITLAKSE